MNVITRLEYELAYYDSAVYRFNHYTTRIPPFVVFIEFSFCSVFCLFVFYYFLFIYLLPPVLLNYEWFINIYLTDRWHPNSLYQSAAQWIWETWQWRGTPHSPKLQDSRGSLASYSGHLLDGARPSLLGVQSIYCLISWWIMRWFQSPRRRGLEYAKYITCKKVILPPKCGSTGYDTKITLGGEVLLLMRSTSSLLSLPGPLWAGEVVPVRVPPLA